MISFIGFLVDLISFLFAVLILPVCTIAFWLTYDDPTLELEEDFDTKTKNNMKG